MYIRSFENFITEGDTSSYPPPKYLAQPSDGDKGFFMFQKQFDALRKPKKNPKKYVPSIAWRFADENKHL